MKVLTVLILFLGVGCARTSGPQASVAFSPGSIGTSGGGDISALPPIYHERLVEVARFMDSKEFDTQKYSSTLLYAALELERCDWNFQERVSFRCGKKGELNITATRAWLGVADDRIAYLTLLELLSKLADIEFSPGQLYGLAEEIERFYYRGVL